MRQSRCHTCRSCVRSLHPVAVRVFRQLMGALEGVSKGNMALGGSLCEDCG